MITRQRAMAKYFINNPRSRARLLQIMAWNEKKTLTENYKKLGMNPGDALNLARTYGLEYKPREGYYYIKKGAK